MGCAGAFGPIISQSCGSRWSELLMQSVRKHLRDDWQRGLKSVNAELEELSRTSPEKYPVVYLEGSTAAAALVFAAWNDFLATIQTRIKYSYNDCLPAGWESRTRKPAGRGPSLGIRNAAASF